MGIDVYTQTTARPIGLQPMPILTDTSRAVGNNEGQRLMIQFMVERQEWLDFDVLLMTNDL